MSTNERADSIKKLRFEMPRGYARWTMKDGMEAMVGEVCKCGHLRTEHLVSAHSSKCEYGHEHWQIPCKCAQYRIHCYVKEVEAIDAVDEMLESVQKAQEIAQAVAVAKKHGYSYVINQIRIAWSKEGDPK